MIERRKKFFAMLSLACMLLVFVSACNDDDDDPVAISAPTLGDPTEITDVSFKVNWTAVSGADKYFLDVSLEEDFTTTITGFDKKEVTGTSFVVTELTPETEYFFRLYAKKGSIISSSSTVKDVTTTD